MESFNKARLKQLGNLYCQLIVHQRKQSGQNHNYGFRALTRLPRLRLLIGQVRFLCKSLESVFHRLPELDLLY